MPRMQFMERKIYTRIFHSRTEEEMTDNLNWTDTNVHPNLLNRKDIEEIKYSLENYFRAKLDKLGSSEKKRRKR